MFTVNCELIIGLQWFKDKKKTKNHWYIIKKWNINCFNIKSCVICGEKRE